MKTIKQRTDLLYKILAPIIVITCAVYTYRIAQLQHVFYLNWLSAVACIFSFFIPQHYFSTHTQCKPGSTVFRVIKTWFIQLTLIFSFIVFCHLISTTALSHKSHQLNTWTLIHRCITQYGLFPWTAYTITSVILAHTAYNKKKSAEFALVTNIKHTEVNDPLGLTINGGLRNTSYIAIALNLLSITLVSCNLFYQNVVSIHSDWSLPQIILSLISLILIYIVIIKKSFHTELFKKLSLFYVIFVLSLSLSLLFGLVYGLADMIQSPPLKQPDMLLTFTQLPWQTVSQISCLMWWLAWLPLVSLILAKQCKDMSVKKSIAMLLSMPTLLSSLFLTNMNTRSINTFFNTSTHSLWIGLIALFILLFLLTSKHNRQCLVNHHLPAPDKVKFRPFTLTQERTTLFFLILMSLYVIGGCHLMNLILIIIVYPSICYVPLLTYGNCKYFYRLMKNNRH